MINKTRLSRDFEKDPVIVIPNIKTKNPPTKEDLEYLYLELGMLRQEVADYTGANDGLIKNLLSDYEIEDKEHYRLRKIYEAPLPEEEINWMEKVVDFSKCSRNYARNRVQIDEKIPDSDLLYLATVLGRKELKKIVHKPEKRLKELGWKYTDELISQIRRNKAIAKGWKPKEKPLSYFEKTGYKCWHQNPENKERLKEIGLKGQRKREETYLKKFGSKSFLGSKAFKDKCEEKYGVQHFSELMIPDEIREILHDKEKFIKIIGNKEKTIKEVAKELNVSSDTIARYRRFHNLYDYFLNNNSYGEEEIKKFLLEKIPNITILRHCRKIIYPYEVDLYLPDYRFGIEFNGLFFHDIVAKRDELDYHQMKSRLAIESKITLYHIWEDEYQHDKEKVLNDLLKAILHPKELIDDEIMLNLDKQFNAKYLENYEIINFLDCEIHEADVNNKHYQYYDAGKIKLKRIKK